MPNEMTASKSNELARQMIDTVLEERLFPHLQARGFRRRDRTFMYQWRDDCLANVVASITKKRREDTALLAIHVGVGFKRLAELLRPLAFKNTDIRWPVQFSTNIGYLRPPHAYQQWIVTPEFSQDRLSDEVIDAVVRWGVPFIDEYDDLDRVIEGVESGTLARFSAGDPVYYLAAAYWVRGDRLRAVETLKRALEQARKVLQERPSRLNQVDVAEIGEACRLFGCLASEATEDVRAGGCNPGSGGST